MQDFLFFFELKRRFGFTGTQCQVRLYMQSKCSSLGWYWLIIIKVIHPRNRKAVFIQSGSILSSYDVADLLEDDINYGSIHVLIES